MALYALRSPISQTSDCSSSSFVTAVLVLARHIRAFQTEKSVLQVDIDLSKEGNAGQVSRQQARLYLKHDGCFYVTNTGRRKLSVNGSQVTFLRTEIHALTLLQLP